jgi:8-oxo-dGTP pyrophosphatase MutT (NUDIX family)
MLKYTGVDGPEIDLNYIVSMIKIEHDTEEWGFPKGRRNKFESEEECALREFKEESGYNDEDIKIIHEIEPLCEDFTGTNGIEYRHVYYVAELISDKPVCNNITESQRDEIGNIQFMDFQTALGCIRKYHVKRIQILNRVFTYYIDRLVVANRNILTCNDDNDINDGNNDNNNDNNDNNDNDDNDNNDNNDDNNNDNDNDNNNNNNDDDNNDNNNDNNNNNNDDNNNNNNDNNNNDNNNDNNDNNNDDNNNDNN